MGTAATNSSCFPQTVLTFKHIQTIFFSKGEYAEVSYWKESNYFFHISDIFFKLKLTCRLRSEGKPFRIKIAKEIKVSAFVFLFYLFQKFHQNQRKTLHCTVYEIYNEKTLKLILWCNNTSEEYNRKRETETDRETFPLLECGTSRLQLLSKGPALISLM